MLAAAVTLALVLGAWSAGAAEHVVRMTAGAYEPRDVTARVGDSLRFVNADRVEHNVFVPTVGHAIDLGKQPPGTELLLPLGKAGRLDVECVFHPDMLATVEVRP